MVSRGEREPMTLHAQRQSLRWATSEEELEAIVARSKAFALQDEAHNRWYLEMLFGKSRAKGVMVPDIGLGDLDSLEECLSGLNLVNEALQAHHISEEHAESFRRTIMAAASIHKMQAVEDAADALEQLGSLPVFLGAGQSTEERMAQVRAAIERMAGESA